MTAPIVCSGRPVDADNRPVGDPCNRQHPGPAEVARAAGWRIGPAGDAMCPRCARPDPNLTRILRELTS